MKLILVDDSQLLEWMASEAGEYAQNPQDYWIALEELLLEDDPYENTRSNKDD